MSPSAQSMLVRVDEFHAYKLFAPPPCPDAIRRDAILQRVFEGGIEPVLFLQAPAGHGKSTTLHQLKTVCEEKGFLTAWLTLDEADNDTRRFLIHFEALIAAARGDSAQVLQHEGELGEFSYHRHRSDWVIDRLVALGRPVALFLDNFQEIQNPEILAFFREFLERLPESARVLIGSRSTPEIGLSRLAVHRRALILRPEELRFSSSEVEQFFHSGGGAALSAEEVERIHSRTEGWPAALQLYRLSMINPDVRRSVGDFTSSRPRELAEYLADNVLALQAPHVQEFLLRTSVLTRLSASLCNAVTARTDSQEMLLYLERSGLFVRSRDSDLQWFEYHGLFQSFLVEQLRHRSETVELECHRAAAQWHLKRHNFEDVVHHAICCGDFSFAATTLDTWGGRLISGAHLITMERWFDRIPFEEVASRRSLLIKCAWALVFLRRRDKLKPLLALLERCQPPFDVRETTDPSIVLSMAAIACDDARSAFRIVDKVPLRTSDVGGFAAFELGAAANLTSFRQLAYGDFEGARDLLSVARAHGDRADANFSRGYTIGVDSVSLLLQGRLPDALDKLKVGSAEQRVAVDRSYATAALACCYIWGLYEANELDMAEALFGQYHDVIADAALLDFLAVAQVSMARIHDVRGRPSKAIATLEEAEAVGHANDSRRYIRLLNWERVRRALLADDIERAQAIADRCSGTPDDKEDPWLLFSEDLEGASLGRIRLAIYCDELELAGELLEREMHRQRTRTFRQIKLHLLDVQLQRRRDSKNVAQRSLRKALQLAAPGRYIRCFLDEGEVVLALLREEFQSLNDSTGREVPGKADRRFVEQLLQASGTDLSRLRRSEERLLLEPLTDKQMEILTFLANGVTNKEMSERLSVSENTVKFHLKNIYSKLAVTSRLQAIASARELGLVK